jgi:hypothetical protein
MKLWEIAEEELRELTPRKARELIVECFFHSQRETYQLRGQQPPPDEELRERAQAVLRLAFREIGGSYEEPTVEDLYRAVEALCKKAHAWGTPPEILEHHRAQVLKVLRRF